MAVTRKQKREGKQLYGRFKRLKNNISHDNLIEKSCVDRHGLSKLSCNCRVREECPVGDECNSENVVYKATIFTMENRKDKNILWNFS